jgi:lipase chaperone LimK
MKKQVSVKELKDYFLENYGYISLELSDKEIYEKLKRYNFQGFSLKKCADLLADYIVSQGLGEVQE